jgi:pimeloyl-ACP methyl ester carboxylesterase
MRYWIRSCLSLGFLPLLAAGCAHSPGIPRDPVRVDPSPSVNPPAGMEEISISNDGARMNGLLYLAAGAGLHPVVLFLHGYPGFERNLDLAQAARRAGYDVIYFDYRGMWGSAGTFSYSNALADVDMVLSWIRSPAIAGKYHFDSTRITLVGHSFGGWLSLMTAAKQPANVCVAAFAAENAGWDGNRYPDHPDGRAEALNYFRATTGEGAPIRAVAEDVQNEIIRNAATWNYLTQANALKSHALLSISSTRDSPDEDVAMHKQLVDAVHSAGGTHVRNLVFEDDHPFSSHRVALAEALVQWLRQDCAVTQP